jgi:hypothetical protein
MQVVQGIRLAEEMGLPRLVHFMLALQTQAC